MTKSLGTGVSRTLSSLDRMFRGVVFQKKKPPLDAEFNLSDDIHNETIRNLIQAEIPSGFFTDPTRPFNDYQFDPQWSNLFILGNPRKDNSHHAHDADEQTPVVWANVNGWIIPIAGTAIDTAVGIENLIRLYPPPASDTRVDFVFLEAWSTLVAPNPSVLNKPDSSHIWKYGNVEYGGTNITDDLEDPAVRFETSKRIQVQYRIRVFGQGAGMGSGVALDVYPDGLNDPNILGRGTATSPVGGFPFENMREELGDPSLWRAGDGNPSNSLGTIDGYTYAIPICAVFRRNSGVYQSVSDAGTANQNGAFLRTPSSATLPDPRTGARVLLTAELGQNLAYDDENLDVDITNLNGSGLEDTALVPGSTFLVIEGEIIGIDSINVAAETVHIPVGGRGRRATNAAGHAIGSTVEFYNSRPDGLFADEISSQDILDLRRSVSPGDWDYQRLLEHNIASLARGDLRTAWKQSGTGTTEGVSVLEVDYLQADGSVVTPNGTEALDGPDGIRQVWSDAAVQQSDVTLLLDNDATLIDNSIGFASADQFDTTVQWAVGPDFYPIGYMNLGGVFSPQAWTNGSSIFLHIGGEDGTRGARGTFRDGSDKEVRFITPLEYFKSSSRSIDDGNQSPVTLRFVGERALETPPYDIITPTMSTAYPGPMYPWEGRNFERPFIVLGQRVSDSLSTTVDPSTFNPEFASLTGLSSVVAGSRTVTGVGTLYRSEVEPDDYLYIGSTFHLVREIVSDTEIRLATEHPAGASSITINKLRWFSWDVGVNFDTTGVWWSKDLVTGKFENDPTKVVNSLLNGRRTLYGMLTRDGSEPTGFNSELYAVTYGDPDSLGNNGVWKIIGAGSSTAGLTPINPGTTRLALLPIVADFTGVDVGTGNTPNLEVRSMEHLSEVGGSYTGDSPDLCIVLTDIGGDDSGSLWDRDALNFGHGTAEYDTSLTRDASVNDKVAVPSKLLLSLTLMYHPGRGGMARIPDEIVRVSLRDANSSYMRRNKADIDSTFPNYPEDETIYDISHVQLWNRLPALGLHAPNAPNYGGNIVGFTEQDREHECFFDRGSKTLLFRPFRDREMTLQALTIDEFALGSGEQVSLIGGYTYPDAHPKDNLQLFTRTGANPSSGKEMGFAVPREFMPRFGRQDIPFYEDTAAGGGAFLNGINHLFRDSTDVTSPVFNIVGGQDNVTGGNEVTSMFFRTSVPTDYGHGISGGNITPTVVASFLEARKTTSINTALPYAQEIVNRLREVNSSDLGKGLKGIQLPPYYGIARLYGVYDARDYETKGGQTFQADRVTLEADPAPNLLKTDATQQTLFILQDGAKDLTTYDGDHTYIIPSEALDITKALNYTVGDKFEDYDYIVECVVFGFARGFISKNNYVLARAHNGEGDTISDGTDPQLEGVHMVIPSAAAYNDAVFVAHNRTVYQGDPYMTRHQSTRVVTDYKYRYGRPDEADFFELSSPIQQYKSTGEFVPETPNARAFEVLASLDFYTTLGTGNVGGDLIPGTFMDIGFLDPLASTRIPTSLTSPPWQIDTRAFTLGQRDNESRAEAIVHIENSDNLNPSSNWHAYMYLVDLEGNETTLVFTREAYASDAEVLALPEENRILIEDVTSTTSELNVVTIAWDGAGATNFYPSQTYVITAPPGVSASPGDLIEIYPKDFDASDLEHTMGVGDKGTILFDGFVDTTGDVVLRATSTVPFSAFDAFEPGAPSGSGTGNVGSVVYGGGSFAPGTGRILSVPLDGIVPGDNVVWSFDGDLSSLVGPSTLQITAYADVSPGNARISLWNPSTALGAADWPSGTFRVTVLRNQVALSWTITLPEADYYVRVIRSDLAASQALTTVQNMATTINRHSQLQTSVRAYQISSEEAVLQAVSPGTEGNGIRVTVEDIYNNVRGLNDIHVRRPTGLRHQRLSTILFSGGEDEAVNGGDGTTQLRLTGMTERLPLGILLQDSDFLGENPLGDVATAMKTSPAGLRPLQTILPLTEGGEEFSRFIGAPGDLIGMADGSVLEYTPYNEVTAPTGAKTLRIYRGGGSAFVLSGINPGGPIDWVSETFPKSLRPVLKGGALVCRALLVRNFYEEPFDTSFIVSQGDEIQMVVITHGVLGDGNTQQEGIELSGIISPSGYGEGYAAADRYRIDGRPMFKGFSRYTLDPEDVVLAPVPDDEG